MTTETTERWDATWSDTGEHPAVNVTNAAVDAAPVYTAEDAQRLAMQNTSLVKRVRDANTRLLDALEQNDLLRAELDALRAELHPLDERRTGWTPGPKAMPRRHWTEVNGVADLTEQQQHAALIAPTLDEVRDGDGEHYLGATVAAELMSGIDHRPGWPTWLGDVHHADATWTQAVTDLRLWADSYTARPVERTVVQPVEVDTSYRESEAALWAAMVVAAAERHVESVYDELAPERIQASDAMSESIPHSDTPDRSDVKRMTARVNGGLSALGASQPETPVQTPVAGAEPHKPWWRRNSEWLISGAVFVAWAAGIGLTIWLTGGP